MRVAFVAPKSHRSAHAGRQAQDRVKTEKALLEAQQGRASLQTQLDEATAIDEQLSKELARLGQNSVSLLSANDSLKGALESSRKRLEELRHAQAVAEARAALYRELALKLKAMVDSTLETSPSCFVTDAWCSGCRRTSCSTRGRRSYGPAGKGALTELAAVLRTISGRRFQVTN
jgi:predicted  nucleic acid-binding Zn-ribbon protein